MRTPGLILFPATLKLSPPEIFDRVDATLLLIMPFPLELKEVFSESESNLLSLDPHAPFTQAYFYGEWQKSLGRPVKRFAVKSGSDVLCLFQLITYPLFRGKNCMYAPYGPVAKTFSGELLIFLKEKLAGLAQKENAVFVRLDFTPPVHAAQRELIELNFKKAPLHTYHSAYFQPRTEWILDLKKSRDELLKDMDPKTRYGIRTAEKRGIRVEIIKTGIEGYFNNFYALMEETSRRNKFGLHPKEYYKRIFDDSAKRGNAYLVIASYEKKILVVDFILVFGAAANYVFSGSSAEHRNLMPSYLAQWEAICHAQKLGCAEYNFGGVAATRDSHKAWEGLSFFKKRFGGKELIHSPFYDLVAQPAWYRLYSLRKLAQKIAA